MSTACGSTRLGGVGRADARAGSRSHGRCGRRRCARRTRCGRRRPGRAWPGPPRPGAPRAPPRRPTTDGGSAPPSALVLGGPCRGVLELDGDPDVAAEPLGQRLGQHPAHPRLEHGLGELVGRGQHGGVLDQAQRPGQVQHRVLLRGQAGGQSLTDLVPDRGQVQRGIGHAARPPVAVVPRPLPDACVHRRIPPLWIPARSRSTSLSTGCARLARICAGLTPGGASAGIAAGQRPLSGGRSGCTAVG